MLPFLASLHFPAISPRTFPFHVRVRNGGLLSCCRHDRAHSNGLLFLTFDHDRTRRGDAHRIRVPDTECAVTVAVPSGTFLMKVATGLVLRASTSPGSTHGLKNSTAAK